MGDVDEQMGGNVVYRTVGCIQKLFFFHYIFQTIRIYPPYSYLPAKVYSKVKRSENLGRHSSKIGPMIAFKKLVFLLLVSYLRLDQWKDDQIFVLKLSQ